MTTALGILAIGVDLPADTRFNDWWIRHGHLDPSSPPGFQRMQREFIFENPSGNSLTPRDPFRGTRSRRVAQLTSTSAEMESAAAHIALKRAEIQASRIGVVATASMPPTHLFPNNATLVQHVLGATNAAVIGLDAACASFVTGMAWIVAYMNMQRIEYGILAVSSQLTRLVDPRDPLALTVGDGAAAVVIGPVSKGRGLVRSNSYGYYGDGLSVACTGEESARWYDGAPARARTLNVQLGRAMVETAPRLIAASIDRLFGDRVHDRAEVKAFYGHQAHAHFTSQCQEAAGLSHARRSDSFGELASMGAASIPINLARDWESGLLATNDAIVCASIGMGFVVASMLMRW